MIKIIAISENTDNNLALGLVVAEPFIKVASSSLYALGFKMSHMTEEVIVLKSKNFMEDLFNVFSQHSCMDAGQFGLFACSPQEVNSMISVIECQFGEY